MIVREFIIKLEVRLSGQFDPQFYLMSNGDLAHLTIAAALNHFVKYGMMEGRRPSADFDPVFYICINNYLINPKDAFLHYIRYGIKDGKAGAYVNATKAEKEKYDVATSGLFDWQFYALAYTDVSSNVNAAFEHFMSKGMSLGRQPSMQFCPEDYCTDNPDISNRADALLHWIRASTLSPVGSYTKQVTIDYLRESMLINKSGLFDATIYLEQQPIASFENWNPLFHFLATGAQFCTEINSTISLIGYYSDNPDLRESKANPLLHWLNLGKNEGRQMPATETAKIWRYANGFSELPDDCVHFELISGRRFFGSYGFNFENRNIKGYVSKCVFALSNAATTASNEATSRDIRVSIIIPVYGQIDYVLSCLDSLRVHRSVHSFEIIVCDDASPDEVETKLLATIPWIRYLRQAKNGGFINCCNYASLQAKGEFFVFLNSDTRVVEGWLDEMMWGFDNLEKAGLIGSKLLNFDGSLQEAGGIIFDNGGAYNYGRNQDSNDPNYCFSREADYISGASIGIARELWENFGGFDVHFLPAYCEDVDLAFKVRQADRKVWYQPFSRVVHYEGITHGRDIKSGIKAYQIENLNKIRLRYSKKLAEHASTNTSIHEAANFRRKQRMLVVDALTPTPDRDSGSIMTAEVMRTYRALGFEQHFVSAFSPRWLSKYTYQLQKDGVCCHYAPFSSDVPSIKKSTGMFELALIYRHYVADAVYGSIRAEMPEARVIFANVDLHYLREVRGAELTGDDRALIRSEFTRTSELALFAKADAAFVHTYDELKIIQSELPKILGNIIVFPWMTDTVGAINGFAERHDLMFLGNFLHAPNVDSALYLVNQIWPLIKDKIPPDAKLFIVGNMPTADVLALISDRVVVTGFVEDMAPYFEKSRLFLAPLRYGAGIKGKIVTAFAHGVPCIATTIAAEGIGEHGAHHLAIEDGVHSFANRTLNLYFNELDWRLVQQAAFSYIEDNYSRIQAEKLCLDGFNIAGKIWRKRQQYKRSIKLKKTMEEQGDFDEEKLL